MRSWGASQESANTLVYIILWSSHTWRTSVTGSRFLQFVNTGADRTPLEDERG